MSRLGDQLHLEMIGSCWMMSKNAEPVDLMEFTGQRGRKVEGTRRRIR
ncbi:MAG: hypothetical protein R2710_25530 [Acidimicrobiales bacterium]